MVGRDQGVKHGRGAFKSNSMVGVVQYDVSGMGIRDYLFRGGQISLFLHSNQFFGCFQCYDFAMIVVSEGTSVKILP